MLARWLAAIAIVASILAAGCTVPDEGGFQGSDAEEGLQTVPIRPDGTEIVVDRGETVVFVVRCDPAGPSRAVEVSWERAVAGEGVDDRELSQGSSEDQHSYSTSFDEGDDYVGTAKCRSGDDRATPHLWDVTVEETENDEGTDGNATGGPASERGPWLPDERAGDSADRPVVRSPDRPTLR